MRVLSSVAETKLLTEQRDEARTAWERHRVLVLELERRAAHAEGEVVALRETVAMLLRQVVADMGLAERNAALSARVSDLEGQLASCLNRATQPAPVYEQVRRG